MTLLSYTAPPSYRAHFEAGTVRVARPVHEGISRQQIHGIVCVAVINASVVFALLFESGVVALPTPLASMLQTILHIL